MQQLEQAVQSKAGVEPAGLRRSAGQSDALSEALGQTMGQTMREKSRQVLSLRSILEHVNSKGCYICIF
jgi:hypothetical protein